MMTDAGDVYTPFEMFWYLGGFLLWGVAYALLVPRMPRDRWVEIPFFAVCGNVTWEFLWGFVWHVEMMGATLQWFYRLGCVLDLFILACIFKYGAKQVSLPVLKRWFAPMVVASLCGWIVFYWTFREMGYDLPLGSNSAYLINVVMSILYIQMALRVREVTPFAMDIGWLKGLGTGMVTVFVFLQYPENTFVKALGILTAILDAGYMALLALRRRGYLAPPEAFAIDVGEPRRGGLFGRPVSAPSGAATSLAG
jgi:hypothetical protein